MSEIYDQHINPMLFWDRYVVPHKMSSTATGEDKAWPSYIIHDPRAVEQEHPNKFHVAKQAVHHGDMQTTYELIWEAFQPIVFMRIAHKRFTGRRDFNGIRYTIGDFYVRSVIDGSMILDDNMERGNVESVEFHVISDPFMQH